MSGNASVCPVRRRYRRCRTAATARSLRSRAAGGNAHLLLGGWRRTQAGKRSPGTMLYVIRRARLADGYPVERNRFALVLSANLAVLEILRQIQSGKWIVRERQRFFPIGDSRRPVLRRAALTMPSFASAPELQKNTLSAKDCATWRAASVSACGMR